MFTTKLALMIGLVVSGQYGNTDGTIRGIVVNASANGASCGQSEVVLCVQIDGQIVPVEKTVTDAQGRFAFNDLPVDREIVYLPGANRDEIHYPGPRVRLDDRQATMDVKLTVRDAVTGPCPLVIKHHEILLQTEPGAVHVTEGILVDNPAAETYVGSPTGKGPQPITLRLGIPADFERITFEEEAFGRQFAVVGDELATDIPWMPGQRWLRFTYTLRSENTHRLWERTVDLPCEHTTLRIQHDKLDEVSCNLGEGTIRGDERVFESNGKMLAQGQQLQVEFGVLPVPWFLHARWIALGVLAGLIGVVMIVTRLKRPRDEQAAAGPPIIVSVNQDTTQPSSGYAKSRRKRKRRAAA